MTNTSRRKVNLEEVYDQQGEIKTEKDAVEVWRSYSEALLGGQTEQDEADTCSEFEAVQLTICGEMVLNPTGVVCWICLYFKTKWTLPFPR